LIIVTGFTDLSAEAHRNQTAALLATTTTLDTRGTPVGLQVFGGVHSGFDHAKTGALTGTVTAGRAVIPSTTAEGGAYVVTMTETEAFAVEPGDGTYNRRDLVCLVIDPVPPVPAEGEPEPEPTAGASIVVVKGAGVTGTTTPPIPATPINAIPLWVIPVGAAASEANGGYSAAAIIEARTRLKLANQDRQPFSMAAGNSNVNLPKNAVFGYVAITFPAGRFRRAPIVTASLSNAPGGSNKAVARVINATTTGASIYVYSGDGAAFSTSAAINVGVNWTAVQMAEDAAAG
jgi:hypothetical protein